MHRFYFKNRSFIGLILILSSTLSLVFYSQSSVTSAIILCALAAGCPFAGACFEIVPFRSWLILEASVVSYGFFIMNYWGESVPGYIGALLLGFGAAGLIFILPANITAEWLDFTGPAILGTIISASIALSLLPGALLKASSSAGIAANLAIMLLAAIFMLHKPVYLNREALNPLPRVRVKNRIKICLFFMMIFCSAAVVCKTNYDSVIHDAGLVSFLSEPASPAFFMNLGLILGPAVTGLLISKKGIYSSCILLIFLSELSALGAGFYKDDFFVGSAGHLAFGALFSSGFVVCSILIYYIFGPGCYNRIFSRTVFFIPFGLAAVIPLSLYEGTEISSQPVIIATLLLLAMSFFIIFSAWKHRLIILK